MILLRYCIFVLVMIVWGAAPVQALQGGTSSGNILVLHSYHPGYRWTGDINRGIEDQLRGRARPSDFILPRP